MALNALRDIEWRLGAIWGQDSRDGTGWTGFGLDSENWFRLPSSSIRRFVASEKNNENGFADSESGRGPTGKTLNSIEWDIE